MARRTGNDHLIHLARRQAAEADETLNELPYELLDEAGHVSDMDALGSRLRSIVANTANGLVVRMTRPPGGAVTNVFVPFRVLFPEGARGFILPDLQHEYLRWRRRQLALHRSMTSIERVEWIKATYDIDEIPPDAAMEMFFGPEAFVRSVDKNSRGGVLIEALMGPSAVHTFGVEVPSKRSLKMWTATNTRRVLRHTPATALADTANAFNTSAGLRSHLNQALEELGLRGSVDEDALANFMEEYILDHIRRDRLAKWHAANTVPGASPPQTLLDELAAMDSLAHASAVVTEDVVTSIVGRKALHPTELAHRMIEAQDLTKQWIASITGDNTSYEVYRALDGFTGLMDSIIRRDGYQKGHVFEIECMVELGEEYGTSGMRLQVYFAGRKGPDFVIDIGGELAIKQAKSYSHFYRLVGSRRRFGGEFLRQFRSDLRRMLAEGDDLWPPGQPPRIRVSPSLSKPVRTDYEFLIDDARLSTWLDPADPDQLARMDDLRNRGIVRIQEFEDEVNGFLRATADDDGARTAIRNKCQEIITNENNTSKTAEMLLGEQIGAVVAGLPAGVGTTLDDIHPRLLFAMRLAMDDKTGAVNVKLAQRIFQMEQPFQIGSRRMSPDSFVPWQGELPDKIASAHAIEDAMPPIQGPWQMVELQSLSGREVEGF